MFTSVLRRARNRFLFYWLSREKEGFAFAGLMISLPVVVIGSIAWLAPAREVRTGLTTAQTRAADLQCLAENIYFEARGEPLDGLYAVAEVTLNRVHSPHFPDTICEVVHEARWDPLRRRKVAHFSWTELDGLSPPRGEAWQQAQRVATAVYDDIAMPVVPDALFYHTTAINPYWAKRKKAVATIGNHIFYE
jgi:spore germination cell wall hydrolase CwlJ-like protein